MHQTRENLDFLFRRLSPEKLLDYIRSRQLTLNTSQNSLLPYEAEFLERAYLHYAPLNMGEYSFDELELKKEALLQEMSAKKRAGIFAPLICYTQKVIKIRNQEPVCRLEEILNWNSITKRLGQDVFICCWLAWEDTERSIKGNWNFAWPAVVKTDDKYLEQIMAKGLAENHFHLHGSTQVFSISWACLMNHPEHISKIEASLHENLTIGISRGPEDNVMDWHKRLLYAVMIRECLCRRYMGILSSKEVYEEFVNFDEWSSINEIAGKIEAFRECYGRKFLQPDQSEKCLDYAVNDSFYQVDTSKANRLLAGERGFLYCCFQMHFQGRFTELESALLHLYLIIKSNFAGELIQNNKLYGFHNFADYQGRKGKSFYGRKEYEAEAYRLSIYAEIQDNYLVSLETRIMPEKNMKKTISEIDRIVQTTVSEKKSWEHYYVIHFPKKKFTRNDVSPNRWVQVPRNETTRKNVRKAAKALKKYLCQYEMTRVGDNEKQRVFGIDACSKEIGCGPETFATEFRYLRECSMHRERLGWPFCLRDDYIDLGITYHAGEDFLDIIDGLRAIDETIEFLQLRRGDRIGHAIALGISAEDFYCLKRYNIYLTKQQYLDNLIWILNRSLEWNIHLESGFRIVLERKARELFQYIYCESSFCGDYKEELLDAYYYSWKLREDHPAICLERHPQEKRMYSLDDYERCMMRTNDELLNQYREMTKVKDLLKLYHYDNDVKLRGLEPEQVEIYDWRIYANLVTEFQEKLQKKIVDREIALECNPTSNVLIGTFRRYDMHPILRFNRHKLDADTSRPNVLVSLNTDDLGVFSTSLGNEYALLLCALRKARRLEGKYDDTVIYEYLDYLRESGINMSFRPLINDVP